MPQQADINFQMLIMTEKKYIFFIMVNFLYTIIIYPLIQLIEFSFMIFNNVFKNEGISVIGVSLAVSIGTLPLYIVAEHWQQVQRDTERKLDPGIQRIKSVFKGDEQYMILSTFYKQNHYHPLMALRSSFGLLIQIPFFIAAYSFLSNLPVLQGKPFLFIHNMGEQDALFRIGSFPINVLPIAMTLINWVAGAIYTKGFKFKDKATIYAMALIFLVILYNSPSGLVIYWTMNNMFSLIKNIFYKIKNPLRVLYIILVVAVISLDAYLIFVHKGFLHKRLLLAVVFSLLLLLPLVVKAVNFLVKNAFQPLMDNSKARLSLFITSAAALAVLAGFVVPSFVINSSAVEFADIDGCGNPLGFLYNSTLQMLGLLVFWPVCIYFLFHRRIQTLMSVFFASILLVAMTDAFCFNGNYGNLSRLITFDSSITASPLGIVLLNIAAVLFVAAIPAVLLRFKQTKALSALVSIILMAEAAISVVHISQINSSYRTYRASLAEDVQEETSVSPIYHLTKDGQNVFVFMFDRAQGAYVETIFENFPELYDKFTGFTFYKNTVSFNQGTLLGSPPLFGGYDYTPAEINRRSSEKLVDKQNQALLLMPRVFTEQSDFTATVSDLSWANYSWIPDMTITDPYPKITGYNVERKYTGLWVKENQDKVRQNITSTAIRRNLAWFSLFKFVPLFARDSVYDDGMWWSSDNQTTDIMEFLDYYSALSFMKRLTDFSGKGNQYFTIVNDTTHSGQALQAPDFEPSMNITEKNPLPLSSSDGNIAVYKRMGEWFDYLKENGCYDNTRIIFVSDHGIGNPEGYALSNYKGEWPAYYNPDHNHPILFMKDFNATGKMKVNNDFMTTADVPSLAFKDIINNAENPFTGNKIKIVPPEIKKASGVVLTHNWRPGGNGIYTFKVPEKDWYTVSKDLFNSENWEQGIK